MTLPSFIRLALATGCLLNLVLGPSGPIVFAASANDWQDFADQLESRRLYRLAAVYLDDQMQQHSQEVVLLRDLAIRRVHIETAWAIESDLAQRREHWQHALQLLQQARQQLTDPQSTTLLELQHALTLLAKAQALREEDQWTAERDLEQREEALANLRETVAELAEIERRVPQLMTDPNASYPEVWQGEQWIAVQRSARFHQARAAFERAYWYDGEDRLNRVEALQTASSALDEVSSQVSREEPLWWEVQLARVQAARQLQDWDLAQRLLQAADLAQAPLGIRPQWVAEVLRVESGLGRSANADRLATAILQGEFGVAPEPLLAVLELFLDRWETTENESYQTQAVALAGEMEKQHGAYWGRRANRLLVSRSIDQDQTPQNLEILIRIADETFLKGQWKESLVTYDRALELARKSDQQGRAAELLARTAAVYQVGGEFAEAANRFAAAAKLTPDQADAGELAWLGISNALAARRGGTGPDETAYRQCLVDFLTTYPTHPRAPDVLLAQAVLEFQQSNEPGVIQAAIAVPLDSSQFLAAASLIQLLIDQKRRATGMIDKDWSQQMRALLEPLVLDRDRAIRPNVTPGHLAAAVLWSQLELSCDPPDRELIADLLQQQLESSTSEDALAWRDRGLLLTIVALAGVPPRHKEVPPYLTLLGEQPPAELLEGLSALQLLMPTLSSEAQRQVAKWQLQLLTPALQDTAGIDPSVQQRLQKVRAWALHHAGDSDAAVDAFKQLLQRQPDDAGLHQDLAQLLTDAGDSFRPQAIEQWRLLGSRSQPRTDRWFLAKYWLIKLTADEGDRQRAAKLLNYLKTVPPGWSDSPLAPKFDQLAKDLLR